MERIQIHVWTRIGAQDMATSVKQIFLHNSLRVITTIEKSVETFVEWCFLNTKRMNVGSRYEHMICGIVTSGYHNAGMLK